MHSPVVVGIAGSPHARYPRLTTAEMVRASLQAVGDQPLPVPYVSQSGHR